MKLRISNRAMFSVLLILAAASWGCRNSSSQGSARSAGGGGGDGSAGAVETEPDAAAEGPEYGGKAVFAEQTHDFGEVEQGKMVSHIFKVRNEGQEVLHIKRVRGT